MPFHDLESGTLRAYNPRRDTALGFSPTPEFYSDIASLWGGVRTAADVGGIASGLGGAAGAFTRLPTKLKKTLEALARTRAHNVRRPDMVPDLVNEGWAALLSPTVTKKGIERPAPVEKFSEADDPTYAKLLTATARNAMRRYIWKNAGAVEEPATTSKTRAALARLENRHYVRTGQTMSDQGLSALLGIPVDTVRQLRSMSGGEQVPINPVTGGTARTTKATLIKRATAPEPEPLMPKELTVPAEPLAPTGPTELSKEARASIARTPLQKSVMELYEQGLDSGKISKELNMSSRRIRQIIQDFGRKGKKAVE